VFEELERYGFLYESPLTKHLAYTCARKNLPKQVMSVLRNVKEARLELYSEDIAWAIQGFLDENNYKGAVALEPQLMKLVGFKALKMENAWFHLLKYALKYSDDPSDIFTWYSKIRDIRTFSFVGV